MTGSFSGMVLGRTIGNPPNSNQADHKLNQVIFDFRRAAASLCLQIEAALLLAALNRTYEVCRTHALHVKKGRLPG